MLIAIVGKIASGKTLILNYLRGMGYPVINSDLVVHRLLKSEEVKKKAKEAFGKEIFSANEIERSKLAKIMFHNPDLKKKLEAILFPYIKEEFAKEIKTLRKEHKIVFMEAPLLKTYDLEKYADKIIYVAASTDTICERLQMRDAISASYAKEKIDANTESYAHIDYIIDNNQDILAAKKQVDSIVSELEGKNEI